MSGLPVGAIPESTTRVFFALARLQRRQTIVMVRDVAAEAGLSVFPTHRHLRKLKAEGLVAWEPFKTGTLRLAVRSVEVFG